MFLILHNIRSAENVGSMFRTAGAFGVTKLYLTGYTPAPVDRFKRPMPRIAKTALGAEKVMPWEKCEFSECVQKLKSEGVHIVALEQDARAVPLSMFGRKPVFCQKVLALVVGNEVVGLDQEALALSDDVVEIPMLGSKESLNVAVAAGIALYALQSVQNP